MEPDLDTGAGRETRPHWQCLILTALPLAFAAWLVVTFPSPAKPAAGPMAAAAQGSR